jgi:hypothetical protein
MWACLNCPNRLRKKPQKQPTRGWRPGEDLIDGYFSRYSFTNITVA